MSPIEALLQNLRNQLGYDGDDDEYQRGFDEGIATAIVLVREWAAPILASPENPKHANS